MALTNLTEKIVAESLREYIELHPGEFCTCSKCLEDITALALNSLPPRYVASHRGEVITENNMAEPLNKTRVFTEVVRAIHTVQETPSHS